LSFGEGDEKTSRDVNAGMFELQDGKPLYTPTKQYYPGRCRKFAATYAPPMDELPAVPAERLPRRFRLNIQGHRVNRRWAAHILNWGLEHNLPFRHALSTPRSRSESTVSSEQPSSLTRIAVIQFALENTTANRENLHEAYPLYEDPRVPLSHCDSLQKSKLMERDKSGNFRINPEHRPALAALMDIFIRGVTLDEDFYAEGQALAEEIIENKQSDISYLLKRVKATSGLGGTRVNYGQLVNQARGIIAASETPVSFEGLALRLGLGGDKDRQGRLHNALAASGVPYIGDSRDSLFPQESTEPSSRNSATE